MSTNNNFLDVDLDKINVADDFKITLFRVDGITYGTPTWIWNVVANGKMNVIHT